MHPDAVLVGKIFLAFTIICVFLVYGGMRILVKHSDDSGLKRAPNVFLTILVSWIGLLYLLSLTGFTSDFSSTPPRMFIILLPLLLGILLLVISGRTDAMLRLVPQKWLVNIQSFRVVVELTLWWMSIKYLVPEQMTFEGYNFDILAGLSAPVIYMVYQKEAGYSNRLLLIWNIISLMLLVNIVTIAILSLPVSFRIFMNEPSAFILSQFPFILLPGVLVPLAYSMHFLSLRKILVRRLH
jgi:hypothetical protein